MYKRNINIGNRITNKFFLLSGDYMGGTPDAVYIDSRIILEVKTHHMPNSVSAVPYNVVTDIPLKYYLQVQHYLNLVQFDTGYLISWTFTNGYNIFRIQRDDFLWENTVKPKCDEFYYWMISKTNINDKSRMAMMRTEERDKILISVRDSMMGNTEKLV